MATLTINAKFCELINKYFTTPLKGGYIPNEYRLPIKKLDDLGVCIDLYCYTITEKSYGIKINSCKFQDENDGRRLYTTADYKSINDVLSFFVNEFLPNFKIDVLNGRIKINEKEKEEEEALLLEFCGLFKDNERVGKKYEKCVVCYEPTKTITGCCKCYLCILCANKLDFEEPNEDDEGEMEFGFKCPHCRALNDELNSY